MAEPSKPDRTVAYYDAHADDFTARTRAVDMSHVYAPFLALVKPGGHILDAGCGSGRDMGAFARHGYKVSGFDGSFELARRAADHTGVPVHHLTFSQVEWHQEFDGVWACASLIHLPTAQLPDALGRLTRAIRPGGILYASFREGIGEGVREGRWFTDQTEERLRTLIAAVPGLRFLRTWKTADARPDRGNVHWLNLLAWRP